MKFISVVTLALSTITSVVALTRDPAVVAAINSRKRLETRDTVTFEDGTMSKCQCSDSPGCDCSGIGHGLFCGNGVFGCIPGHVYQCSIDGHTTCDFGIRNSCVQCGKLSCP